MSSTFAETTLPEAPHRVLGVRLHATNYNDAIQTILGWADRRESRYVCFANVHMVMEANDSPEYREVVNGADLATCDGKPLAWTLQKLGVSEAQQVCGPSLMPKLLSDCAERGVPVGLYGGGSDESLEQLTRVVTERFPGLNIAYVYSPPFRPLTAEEDAKVVSDIVESGAKVLFVALGCPKQEKWMAAHRGTVPCVMLGVGAAFDFIAGTKAEAPALVRRFGMEWAFRLATEPKRLWRRYARHNPRFMARVAMQLMRRR